MIFDFHLQILSPEALYGLCVALVFVILLVLLWPRRPNVTRNDITIEGSKGTSVDIDQSRHVDVKVKANITVNRPAPQPERPKRSEPSPRRSSEFSQDDVIAILLSVLGILVFVGFYYVRHFELITIVSRTLCFAVTAYALLGLALDVHWRGPRFDEIKAGYLLAGIAGSFSAAFLLQAQALISADVVQAATATRKGAIDFFLHDMTQAVWMYLLASLLTTAIACFVAVMSLLAILRALLLSWSEPDERSRLTSLILGATDWVAPVPFLVVAALTFGFLAVLLYVWLPNALLAMPLR